MSVCSGDKGGGGLGLVHFGTSYNYVRKSDSKGKPNLMYSNVAVNYNCVVCLRFNLIESLFSQQFISKQVYTAYTRNF